MAETALNLSTGIPSLDGILDGLYPGDNVVWVGDRPDLHTVIEAAFLSAEDAPRAMVLVGDAKVDGILKGVEVIDARPGQPDADLLRLEQRIINFGSQPGARIVIRDLDNLVRRLGAERALGFFVRTCPRLFDTGALAYWRATHTGSDGILGQVQNVTQCVLDHTGGRLKVVKAETRPGVAGRIYEIGLEDGIVFEEVKALGRLAEGIRRLRMSRGLTQAEMARFAGVSQSAIAQTESGHRGLNLETLLTLGEALGVSLDEILDHEPRQGYVLARRDRIPARRGVVPLLDDPDAGLRAYLVRLGPGQSGSPAVVHKGAELVMVGSGVIQIQLNEQAPVLRSGDALLVTTDAINGWRNLLPEPAQLFWIVRD